MEPTAGVRAHDLQNIHDLPDALLPQGLVGDGLEELRAHEPDPTLDAAFISGRGPVLALDLLDGPAADRALQHLDGPGLVGEEPGVVLAGAG